MFLCHTFDIYPHGVKAKKHFLESNLAQGSIFNQATISVQGDDCPLKMVSLLTSRKRPNPKCPGNSLNAEVPPSPEWLTLSWGRTTNLKGSFIVWKVPNRASYDWFCYDWFCYDWLKWPRCPFAFFPLKRLFSPTSGMQFGHWSLPFSVNFLFAQTRASWWIIPRLLGLNNFKYLLSHFNKCNIAITC